MAFSDSRK